MPNIVVLVKQVPDTWSERKLSEDDYTLDRDSADAVLDEINENAVEAALELKEAHGGNVTVATVGPERAVESLRKALAMGADDAVILSDDAVAGSDAVQTAWALSNVLDAIGEFDVVIAGNASTDGGTGTVPAALGVYRGLPVLTHMRSVAIEGETITGERETEDGIYELKASLPAIVSVTEKANSPRFASFKGIMAAKKKPVRELTLADVAAEPEQLGVENSATNVTGVTPKPEKSAGEIVADDGAGADKIAEFLKTNKFI
ncbi:electron transfer flavoprotein subunit beta [Corynebacterium sphenisci DSM 44792]|uniref:Electron transfer flavoprotein subunit beta n=1 Tax=Corynebacterium sphenisci DSM 44792 TaxID=1437874 RepID=A0A1L7CX17_9CORY|nr:electron transfer flavoprotein subunit beta/FixA family protein [Corynebacterium sphenisci]APT90425.1 electron transfer flavoprotein subunit beta [Corynebacterium sphenisci DSM 44792]